MFNLKKSISIAVLAGLGVAVFLLSSQAWNPSWNPFKPAVKKGVIEEAIGNLLNLKTMKIEANVNLSLQKSTEEENQLGEENEMSLQGLNIKKADVLFKVVQLLDRTQKDNSKSSTLLDLIVGIEGMELSFQGELKSAGKDVYARVTSLPAFIPLGIDNEAVKNQWFKIDIEKISGIAEKKQSLDFEKAQEEAFLKDVNVLLKGKQIFKIDRALKDEEIDSDLTRHYLVSLDKKTVKEVIPQFLELFKKYVPENQKESYEESLKNIADGFSEKFDSAWKEIGGISFEAWVSNNGRRLKKLLFTKTIEQNSITVEFNFSDFNKKIEIEIPQNYKPIEDLFPSDSLNSLPLFDASSSLPENIPAE